ncbi:signal peptidase I [Halobacillus sp. MO56]
MIKKTLKIASSTFLALLAIAAIAVVIVVFQSKGDIEKAPDLFGYKPLTILSNSMEPAFSAGDVILINVNNTPKEQDVITFKHSDGILVTHRVINIVEKEGKTFYETKGDNNNVEDKVLVPTSDVLGVQQVIIPNAGYVAEFVSGPVGFFLLIAMPILAVLVIEIFQRLGIIGQRKKEQVQN